METVGLRHGAQVNLSPRQLSLFARALLLPALGAAIPSRAAELPVHVQDYNRLVEIINGRFEKGRGLLNEGRYEPACAVLSESLCRGRQARGHGR